MMSRQNSITSDSKIGREKNKEVSGSIKAPIERRRSHIPVVQNVLLIWLDSDINDKQNNYFRNAMVEFRRVVNSIKTFTECDQCTTFLSEINNEKACLIVSGVLCQQIVPMIHKMWQVDSIFILCDNKKQYKRWAKEWPKIIGVFTDTTRLCEALKEIVKQCEHDSIGINFMPMNNGAVSDKSMEQLDCSFMYSQILKEILFSIQFDQQHIKKFIDYCREIFSENERELNNITKFKQTYHEKTPIWWYTYKGFLNPMLNRALRIIDVEIIIKMGFFIVDLYRQIEQLYLEQFRNHLSGQLLTVYRGQGLSKTDFEQMMKTMGGFISFNNFLSTSTNSKKSLHYARCAVENPDLIGVFFVMTVDPSKPSTPFALIDKVSYSQNTSDDVLFSMYTVFRIRGIKQMDENDRLWQVDMTMTTGNEQELRTFTERIHEETYPNSKGWPRLGLLLIKLGLSDKSEQVYKVMLEQTSDAQEKAGIYHQLGWIKDHQGQYEQAMTFYKKALEISLKMLPSDHADLALSYNNIGLVYYNMGQYPKALWCHEKALEIRQKTLPATHRDLAMSNNNIGMVHLNMEMYLKAAPYCQRAVQIGQQSLPPNHPHLQQYRDNFDLVKKKL